jgi:phosphoglycerol transferase MdoB-like AlkP superfamily enzyme
MDLDKLKKKADRIQAGFHRGIRGFVILLAAALILLTGLTFKDYKKASLSEVSLSGIRELVMIDNEVEAVQKFRPWFSDLDSIYVYFANEQEGKNQGTILFTIYDKNGEEVVQKQMEAKDISNKTFTRIELGQKLSPGASYRLVVSGTGLTAGKSPILYREKKSWGGNGVKIGKLTYVGKMEVRYDYPGETILQMFLLIGLFAGVIALTLIPSRRLFAGKKRRIAALCLDKILFILAPVAAFFVVEHFTYNSIGDIYIVGTLLNLAIYYIFYLLAYALSGSRKGTLTGCLLLSYVLGAANYFVLTFRGSPILPTDIASFKTAMNVAENYSYTLSSAFFTNAFLVLVCSVLYWKCEETRPDRQKKVSWKKRAVLLSFALALTAGVGGLIFEEDFLKEYNVKADIWNQKRGYSRDGALASFFLNTKYLHAQKPEGYSVDRVKEIAETYIWDEGETASLNGMSTLSKSQSSTETGTETSTKTTTETTKVTTQSPNIIMIMNEAFSDLSVINPIETNQDYMPFIHSLKKNTIKGNLFVSIFGSGTCNSEFEVLTGNSMSFLPSGSIGYTQFVKDAMPNLVQTLKAQGYAGNIAVHPYLADGWNRPTVYPLFGFEQFLSQDDFEDPEMVRKYISDEEDFKKLISLYEEQRESGEENPLFLFTVTMQNHGGFSKDYGNLEKEIEITDETLKDDEAEQYLSLIKKSDDAFQMLVNYFEEQDEPTMIVMWGDHQPSIHDTFYQKLYGKDMSELTTEELQKKYQVPFIIWANYDIEEKEIDALSANYLGSYVLETAGLSMTPYQRYLYDLSKKLPVINSVGYIGDDGQYYEDGEESDYSDYIENYKILQYNNVIDYKNRYENFFGTENLVD